MCGRYRLSRRKQLVEEYFDTTPWEEDWNPRFNIAPTQPVPLIRNLESESSSSFRIRHVSRPLIFRWYPSSLQYCGFRETDLCRFSFGAAVVCSAHEFSFQREIRQGC